MTRIKWRDPKTVPTDGRPVLVLVEVRGKYDEPYLSTVTAYYEQVGVVGAGRWYLQINGKGFDGLFVGWAPVEQRKRRPFAPMVQHTGDGFCYVEKQEPFTAISETRAKEHDPNWDRPRRYGLLEKYVDCA
jgi:hypothetical protein